MSPAPSWTQKTEQERREAVTRLHAVDALRDLRHPQGRRDVGSLRAVWVREQLPALMDKSPAYALRDAGVALGVPTERVSATVSRSGRPDLAAELTRRAHLAAARAVAAHLRAARAAVTTHLGDVGVSAIRAAGHRAGTAPAVALLLTTRAIWRTR